MVDCNCTGLHTCWRPESNRAERLSGARKKPRGRHVEWAALSQSGWRDSDIARHYSVSRAAVCQARKLKPELFAAARKEPVA